MRLSSLLYFTLTLLLLLSSSNAQERNRFTGQSARAEAPFTGFEQFNRRFRTRRRRPIEERCIPSRRTQTFSGFCNNLHDFDFGKTETPFVVHSRVVKYDVSKLPNPRVISNLVCRAVDEEPIENRRDMSELVMFMGQFIDHTVTETENSKDPWPIDIPSDDPVFNFTKRGKIQFFRSVKGKDGRFDSTINKLSAYLDLDVIYGHSLEGATKLRTMKHGLLKEDAGEYLTTNRYNFYVSGDNRVNENPGLTSLHTLFNREHNRIAKEVKSAYPYRDDDWIFQLARKINIAQFQAIVYYGFLPAVMGRQLRPYRRINHRGRLTRGYRRRINPGIRNEFSTVGFRVGHTLINSHMTSINRRGRATKTLLRDAFFQPRLFEELGMDNLLRGMVKTKAAEIDNVIVPDLQDFLVNNNRTMLDLAALNIQRGRDHGVPRYNDLRRAYNLRPVRTFGEITSNRKLRRKLKEAYGSVYNIDAWVGGISEDHRHGSSLGPLFYRIWRHQFRKLRHGDRFFFERPNQFKYRQIRKIPTLRQLYGAGWVKGRYGRRRWNWNAGKILAMKRVLVHNTGLKGWEVESNPFFVPLPSRWRRLGRNRWGRKKGWGRKRFHW